MLNNEIASLMNEPRRMYTWAQKVGYKMNLDAEEKEISSVVDAWAKKIGDTGKSDNEIANYIIKTVEPEIYNAPDELLDSLFNRGSVGEFDDKAMVETPKNTLIAYEAVKGGTVDKSYIDTTKTTTIWKHKQVETEVSYLDLRKNGFKTIANLTMFAEEALKNKMFFDIFSIIDAAIAGGEQVINAGGNTPTQNAMDQLALYTIDRGENPMAISLSKYAQAIARMAGHSTFMSDDMKNEFNRYGLVNFFNGVRIGTISSAHKTGDGNLLLPDKRIFGLAGKIGDLDMRGELRVYETPDNKREVIELKVTGFEFGVLINKIDKICKIVMS